MDIYVGNLPYSATEEELSDLFAAYGPVKRVTIIKDRETGRSKGFGFVVLQDEAQVQGAIEAINGAEFGGRVLKANGSEPKPRFKPGGSGGERKPYNKGGGNSGSGGRRDLGDNNYGGGGGGGDYGEDRKPYKGGGGKSKGSQKGKRRQKGGYDEGW